MLRVCFSYVDSKGNPRSMTNSKGKKRQVNGKELNAALKTNDALFVDFLHRCLEWVPSFDVNAFKCNLKELAPKSALSAWGQRSLACACPVAGYIDHVIHRSVQFPFVLGSVSHFLPLPPSPQALLVFLYWCFFSVTGACSCLWCGGSWLGCAVVPVMGALFQSRGWLPIVEAPGYSRQPTSILAMQLLNLL